MLDLALFAPKEKLARKHEVVAFPSFKKLPTGAVLSH
jgi:hypothetical protein